MDPNLTHDFFKRRQPAIVDLIQQIVEIESPSFNIEGSSRVADWIEDQLSTLPLEISVERLRAENVGDHLLIRAFASPGEQTLLLGHTDTVHPIGTKLKNPTRVKYGKLYGCGVFDMKANIVLVLESLRCLAEHSVRPKTPITILLSCDEEVGSGSGRELVEQEARSAVKCLVLEPSSDGKVKTGRKGTGMFTLRTRGIPAHAGLDPERGASSILEIARQIEKIHMLNAPGAGTTANVCTIQGGTTSNVIPEHAEATIDVRFSLMSEADRIERSIRQLSPFDERVSLQIEGGINRPPLERSEAVVELYNKAKALAASFGYDLGETSVGGASDGNFVAARGVPVLDGLGITGDGAHTLNEHILVDDIADRATLVTLILAGS